MVFFLPLVAAGVHMAVAFPMIGNLLKAFNMKNTELYRNCTIGVYLGFAVLYILIYSLTALSEELQRQTVFEFGSIEDHLKYREAVMRVYPYGQYPVFEGCNHMQYQIRDPKGFAKMLDTLIEKGVPVQIKEK